MADIYVLCPHAVMRCGVIVAGQGNALLLALTDQVRKGRLVFPSSVARECLNIDQGADSTTWIKAVGGYVTLTGIGYQHQEWVLDHCEEVLDENVVEWQANVDVLAMCKHLLDDDRDFCVVTNDRASTPLRMCLAEACSKLGFPEISFENYLRAESLP